MLTSPQGATGSNLDPDPERKRFSVQHQDQKQDLLFFYTKSIRNVTGLALRGH